MDERAIEQAADRLERAELAGTLLKNAKSYRAAEAAWTDVLASLTTFYNKLEQGAKGHGRSEAWFGREKSLRRKDPLLKYARIARNCEEHGLERVTHQQPSGMDERAPIKIGYGEAISFDLVVPNPDGEPDIIPAKILGPTLSLVRVRDSRSPDFADPPREHLGQPLLTFGTPSDITEPLIFHMKRMLADARKFVE
ncbi:MAG: hypothetical protein ACREEY_04725 [Brevundimonas sp.]